jgi:diguanylate cyclase (GGDEF)-like protein
VGLGWAWWLRKRRIGFLAILGLAALSSSTVLSVVLLPSAAMETFLFSVWPFLLPLQVLGIGTVLERERRLFAEEQPLIYAAERDPLTGLLNRRGFEASIPGLSRSGQSAGLLLIDLDHFKRVNDLHGDAASDAVLQEVGSRLIRGSRPIDLVGRFGGEKLAVFLPGLTVRQSEAVSQRICALIEETPLCCPRAPA